MDKFKEISWDDFTRVDLRIGTIIEAHAFPEAQKPAYKLTVDLGELGIKKSSAQITAHYESADLIGKQVLCVVNLKPRQIANFISEVLVTGFYLVDRSVILATSDKKVPNGAKLH